jgi:hypothetical protein
MADLRRQRARLGARHDVEGQRAPFGPGLRSRGGFSSGHAMRLYTEPLEIATDGVVRHNLHSGPTRPQGRASYAGPWSTGSSRLLGF